MGTITLNDEGRLLKAAYDVLFPVLTMEETLMFSQVPTVAIAIRLEEGWNSRSLSASKKKSQVQALIDQLDFRSITNTK